MISPYHSIISYKEDNWQEFLERVLLIDIFMPIIKYYREDGTIKPVIQYIVYAYSRQSDKIVLGLDWHQNKKRIFEFVDAKPELNLYESLVLLQNEAVLEAVNNWIEFQDNDTFRQLCVLKDLRVEMQISANTPIKKVSGEIDFDQKFKNAQYAADLTEMIKRLQNELIQNDSKLKDAVREIKVTRTKDYFGPEIKSK